MLDQIKALFLFFNVFNYLKCDKKDCLLKLEDSIVTGWEMQRHIIAKFLTIFKITITQNLQAPL